MSQFLQALASLLPQGYAWPRDPDSVLMRVMEGLAARFEELHEFTGQAVREWQPHTTQSRMAEWEAATSLPDPWTPAGLSLAERRTRLLARLRGLSLPYADSSPAAPAVIEALCAALGYDLEISYDTPARFGTARCGDRFGALDGMLVIRLHGIDPAPAELEGFLNRVMPARYGWHFLYD